jgi:hypothetical protein
MRRLRRPPQQQPKGGGGRSAGADGHVYGPVAAIAVSCYLNSLHGEFVHDDVPAVQQNQDVLALTTFGQLFANDFWGVSMADSNSHKSYRPLTVLSFRSVSAPLLALTLSVTQVFCSDTLGDFFNTRVPKNCMKFENC